MNPLFDDIEKAYEWIQNLEEKYPVENWIVDKIHVWPLLKLRLYMAIFNHFQGQPSSSNIENGTKSTIVGDLIYSIQFFLRRYRKCDYIFSGSEDHRVVWKNKMFNRFLDPLIDFLEVNESLLPYLIEYKSKSIKPDLYKTTRVIKLYQVANTFFRVRTIIGRFIRPLKYSLYKYDSFLDELNFNGVNIKSFEVPRLNVLVNKIQTYTFLYGYLFKRVKPKYCFVLCYYNTQAYGAILAAHKSGVLSVDIQHGVQTPLDPAYAGFTKLPLPGAGFELLPNIFWSWNWDSAQVIKSWSDKFNKNKVIIGGHTWIDYLRFVENDSFSLPDNIILFTMQPYSELLDKLIIEAIKVTHSKFSWWIRLHPRQLDRVDDLKRLLKDNGILDKVNIDDASSIPLPFILRKSVLHITRSSATVIEASFFNLRSIIIDSIGQNYFKHLITKGYVIPFIEDLNIDNFVALINSSIGKNEMTEASTLTWQEIFKKTLRN